MKMWNTSGFIYLYSYMIRYKKKNNNETCIKYMSNWNKTKVSLFRVK